MKLNYYKNLDGVRAIAIILVMVFHFFQILNVNENVFLQLLKKISIFGQTGVDLFFVLSGFLITRILLSTKENPNFFRNFILKRTVRIFPLYYLFLIIFYFFQPLISNNQFVPFNQQWYSYLYLQNFATTFGWDFVGPSHFWSLSVEEHFYLFWPLLIFFLDNKKIYYLIGLIVLFSVFLRYIMLCNEFSVFYFTFTRLDSLALGALLSLLELKKAFKKSNISKFVALLIFTSFLSMILWIYYTGESNIIIETYKYLLLAIIYFALIGIIISLKEKNIINQILKNKFFSYSGKISYGLYVYHPLSFLIVFKFLNTQNWVLLLISCFLLSYLISSISYHFFEVKFLNLKKYFENENTNK
jgi:peptidoglycan/LPS O-acetylase OafA/YrhL